MHASFLIFESIEIIAIIAIKLILKNVQDQNIFLRHSYLFYTFQLVLFKYMHRIKFYKMLNII